MNEETLYDKMLIALKEKVSYEHWNVAEVVCKTCERIAKQAQIDLLNEILKDTVNTNANFRLKIIVKINELEND